LADLAALAQEIPQLVLDHSQALAPILSIQSTSSEFRLATAGRPMHKARNASMLAMRWGKYAPLLALGTYALLLVIGTHLPPMGLRRATFDLPLQIPDKLAHSCAYAGLTFLVLVVWRTRRRAGLSNFRKAVSVGILCFIIAICGLLDEATQPYVGRHFDWYDWMANLTGMTSAVVTSTLIPRLPRLGWLAQYSVR